MCILCNQGMLQNHFGSRRNFLKGAAATGVAAAGLNLFAPRPAAADCRTRRSAAGQRQAGPALRHSRRLGDVDGPEGRRLRPGRRAGRGQEDPRRRTEPAGGHRRRDRRPRAHRHARLHRYASPPVRDGAAQLPRRRGPDQRRLRHAEREHDLLRVHSATSSPRCTGRRTSTSTSCSAGSASSTTASRRCTTSRRSITRRSTPTPPSRRCSIPGAAPPSAISRARAAIPGEPVCLSAGRVPHQQAVVLARATSSST